MEPSGVLEIKDDSPVSVVPGRLIRASYEFVNFGDILVMRNIYPHAADVVRVAEMVGLWREATLANGPDRTYTDSTFRSSSNMTFLAETAEVFRPLVRSLEFSLNATLRLYRLVNKFAPETKHTGFELTRYGVGQKFDEHVDVIPGHPQWGYRRISAICYLNDDFEGGDLHFPRQSVSYKPEAGSIILFPSDFTYPHLAKTVTRGAKYCVVTWF